MTFSSKRNNNEFVTKCHSVSDKHFVIKRDILGTYFEIIFSNRAPLCHFPITFWASIRHFANILERERERRERTSAAHQLRRSNFAKRKFSFSNIISSKKKKKRTSERTHLRRGRERERGRPASSKYIFSERLRSSSTGLPSSTSQSNERSQEREREHGRRRRIVFKVHLQRAAPIFKTKQASSSDHFCDREVQNKNKNKNNFTVYSNIPS